MEHILNLEGKEFITAAYRLVLGREPDRSGLLSNLAQLKNKVRKEDLLIAMIESDECRSRGELPRELEEFVQSRRNRLTGVVGARGGKGRSVQTFFSSIGRHFFATKSQAPEKLAEEKPEPVFKQPASEPVRQPVQEPVHEPVKEPAQEVAKEPVQTPVKGLTEEEITTIHSVLLHRPASKMYISEALLLYAKPAEMISSIIQTDEFIRLNPTLLEILQTRK